MEVKFPPFPGGKKKELVLDGSQKWGWGINIIACSSAARAV
jgi:hypothetical protein